MSRLPRPEPTLRAKGTSPLGQLEGMVIVAALAIGLGAAGCGGGSRSTTSTPTTAITKAEFVAKANAICGKGDPVLLEAGVKLASHPTKAQIAALVKGTYVPTIEAQITEVKALGAPSGDQAAVARMFSLAQADLHTLKNKPTLVTTDVFADFAQLAHPYGLTACAPTS
jgi:hypothetical protein